MEQELREINSNHLSIGKHFDKSDAGTLRTKELIFFGLHFQVVFFFWSTSICASFCSKNNTMFTHPHLKINQEKVSKQIK